jgi:26S proteasome regulatory subunit N1
MNDMAMVQELMTECTDRATLKQMAFMLARQRNPYTTDDEEITKIVSNEKLSEHYKSLARELNVLEPKHPD